MQNRFWYIIILSFIVGCSTDSVDDTTETAANNTLLLSEYVEGEDVRIDNVIACASGSTNPNEVIAYVYPRSGATDIRYFETENVAADKNEYTNYQEIALPEGDFFNGYLKTFTRETIAEKWIIVSFRESGQIHLSNPIRLKHQSQNTNFGNLVDINQSIVGSPVFKWEGLINTLDAIYFQAVTDASDELLSGTYTFDPEFQYYELDNVVLNITEETPPDLISGAAYGFTLMGVSEDNWVNTLIRASFIAE